METFEQRKHNMTLESKESCSPKTELPFECDEATDTLQPDDTEQTGNIYPRGVMRDLIREGLRDLVRMQFLRDRSYSAIKKLLKDCAALREKIREDSTQFDKISLRIRITESKLQRAEKRYIALETRVQDMRQRILSAILKAEDLDLFHEYF